jgi:hypothetical protein
MSEKADRVHLIGSVPLPDCEQVFRRVGGELDPYLRRMPDGETGERGRWIFFQNTMLRAHPAMEEDPTEPPFRSMGRQSDTRDDAAALQAWHRSG